MENLAFLSSLLHSMLWSAKASEITEIFLWILVFGFVAAVSMARVSRAPHFVSYAPTLLTSVGILGTFVGIVVGLMHFDPQSIDNSIPALLEGLKTAFITSLAGMGSAIVFKVLWTTQLINPPRKQPVLTGIGPEEILEVLVKQNETLADLKAAISGSEETSLVGQFKLMRSDQNDQHKEVMRATIDDRDALNVFAEKLWQQLDQFAEMLSKSATEQVIKALREVIIDFNKNLTEQFGDNFKALDASVQKLVEWQLNYRQQLEQMSAQYEQGVQAIVRTEASVAHISEESQQIPATMEKLKEVLEVNQHQLIELSNHLEAFRDMRDRAVEAVPQIHAQVEQTIKEVAASVEAASNHYTELLDLSDAYIEAHDQKTHELLEQFVKTTGEGIDKVKDGLGSSADEVKSAITAGAREFDNSVQQLQSNLTSTSNLILKQSDKIREQLENTMHATNAHVRVMMETMSGESKNLLDTLKTTGTQIQRDTQSTQKLVADSIEKMQSRLESVMEEVFATQVRATNRAAEGILEEMRKAVATTGEGINRQLSAIDEAMQKEIDRVMNEMGRALAQIAGKFTEDYTKLVTAMAHIVAQGGNFQAQHRRAG